MKRMADGHRFPSRKPDMLNADEVIWRAREEYGAPICLDFLKDALEAESLEEAIEILVTDSYYWDYSP